MGHVSAEFEAQKKLRKIRAHDKERRREKKGKLAQAGRDCQEAIERYEVFDAAMNKARKAMDFIDLETGELQTGEQAQGMFEAAADVMQGIDNTRSKEEGVYIRNRAPGLCLATTDLHTRLSALFTAYTPVAVCLACLICRLLTLIPKRHRSWHYTEKYRQLLGAFALLKKQLGMEKADELLETVKTLLEQRHRASSAIEGFNAALRLFLYVHKGVTQNFLELFRAYYNLRTRLRGQWPMQLHRYISGF